MHAEVEIAIIDTNILCAIGLRELIGNIIPSASIRIFNSFDSYIDDTPDLFVHTFVAERIYLEHVAFFSRMGHKAIVLTTNDSRIVNAVSINVNVSENELVRSLISLRERGQHTIQSNAFSTVPHELSTREIEVLALIAQGKINKEIADILNISLTTVISHRKNIQDKLQTKSVSGLTIYAILNGYVDLRDV